MITYHGRHTDRSRSNRGEEPINQSETLRIAPVLNKIYNMAWLPVRVGV